MPQQQPTHFVPDEEPQHFVPDEGQNQESPGPRMSFDQLTAIEPHGTRPGVMGNITTGLSNIGSGVFSLATPLFHPKQFAKSVSDLATNPVAAAASPTGSAMLQSAREHPLETAEQFAGQMAAPELGARAIGMGKGAVGMARNFRPTSSPEIVPPIQTAAEKLAGSIVPKAKQIPGFVEGIQRNAGNLRNFVEESKNPMRTQAEFEKALQGAGEQKYQHFNQNILEPNAQQPIEVDPGYGGIRAAENTATLGDINRRIGRLNNLMSPKYVKANPVDVAAELAKTPMEQLQAEHANLVPRFHQALSEATGIPVDDIANLRQDFGSLRSLAGTVGEARAGRIGKVGSAAESSTAPSVKPSLIPFLDQGIDFLRGGRNAIADRAFQRAYGKMAPLAGEGRPLPQSPEGYVAGRQGLAQAKQAAAQQEFLHANDLEQAAQDAAAGRAGRTSGFKMARDKLAESIPQLEGESARTIGRQNALEAMKKRNR